MLTVNDLSKVILDDFSSGLDGFCETQYEITFSNGIASLFVTKQDYHLPLPETLSKDFDLKKTKKRRFLKRIPISTIDSLIKYVSQQPNTVDLNLFGINGEWISKNYRRIAESFYPAENPFSKEQKELVAALFKDIENYKNAILDIPIWHDVNDHCNIKFVTKTQDTIKFAVEGQGSYLLYPWYSQNETNKCYYDPRISLWFANLIPYEVFSNKSILKGQHFLNDLTKRMFQSQFGEVIKPAGGNYIRENQIDGESLKELKKEYGIDLIFNNQNSIYFSTGYNHAFYAPSFYVRDISFMQNRDSMSRMIGKAEEIKNLFVSNSIIKQNINSIKNLYIDEYSNSSLKTELSDDLFTDLRLINKSTKRLTALLNFTHITIFEKDNSNCSDWLMDKKGKLILWKYSNSLPFNIKSKKLIGKFREDYNMYIVLKEIE